MTLWKALSTGRTVSLMEEESQVQRLLKIYLDTLLIHFNCQTHYCKKLTKNKPWLRDYQLRKTLKNYLINFRICLWHRNLVGERKGRSGAAPEIFLGVSKLKSKHYMDLKYWNISISWTLVLFYNNPLSF